MEGESENALENEMQRDSQGEKNWKWPRKIEVERGMTRNEREPRGKVAGTILGRAKVKNILSDIRKNDA